MVDAVTVKKLGPGKALRDEVSVPGDKSISHRALIMGAMAQGSTRIEGLSLAEDVGATWQCLRELGVNIVSRCRMTTVSGRGWRGLAQPKKTLEAGNSGTTARLLMGLIAANPVAATISGDASLNRRPMGRVAQPLRRMGAIIDMAPGDLAPVEVRGAALAGIDHVSPIPSAQVKSAVLIAGVQALGDTSVSEPALSRDHTERMLPVFGIPVRRQGLEAAIKGGLRMSPALMTVPGDLSCAAFWIVAAALAPGSLVRLPGVGTNPTRAGFLEVLKRMGAQFSAQAADLGPDAGYEPAADIEARSSALTATDIQPAEVPALIDEVPILALAACLAKGVSRFRGLGELRHKESNRLEGLAGLLRALGAKAEASGDDLVIEGVSRLTGARVSAGGDHRLAMTAMIAGLVAEGETVVEDASTAAASYPGFTEDLRKLGGL
ncbi:MAG: 3-phosphoshikimate 1-carboxyvinyltransferase [Elusimicrobia bacterium]|nr:3-phosphoshikimate 1-carboxyvinyltransferase [Elusimicrobiota bacterium]